MIIYVHQFYCMCNRLPKCVMIELSDQCCEMRTIASAHIHTFQAIIVTIFQTARFFIVRHIWWLNSSYRLKLHDNHYYFRIRAKVSPIASGRCPRHWSSFQDWYWCDRACFCCNYYCWATKSSDMSVSELTAATSVKAAVDDWNYHTTALHQSYCMSANSRSAEGAVETKRRLE